MHVEENAPTIDDGPLVTIARFRSAAEAGYFADEIETREAVRAILATEDDFDAASGRWNPVYVLRVPASEAKRISQSLRELVAETDAGDENASSVFRIVRSMFSSGESGSWFPFALAVAAGATAFWATQQGERRSDDAASLPSRPAAPLECVSADS